jgi:hypothetical protein
MQALTTALPSSSSSQVRELEELCHSLADAAEASTAASKKLLVGKIKIGAPLASNLGPISPAISAQSRLQSRPNLASNLACNLGLISA